MRRGEIYWDPEPPFTCKARLTPFNKRSRSNACVGLNGNPLTITPGLWSSASLGFIIYVATCLAKFWSVSFKSFGFINLNSGNNLYWFICTSSLSYQQMEHLNITRFLDTLEVFSDDTRTKSEGILFCTALWQNLRIHPSWTSQPAFSLYVNNWI